MYYTEDEYPFDRRTLPQQTALLQSLDWDVLIVLDAARWDAFSRMISDTEPVVSPASHTGQWVQSTWIDTDTDWSDVTYISSNAMIEKIRQQPQYGGIIEDHVDTVVKEWDLDEDPEEFRDEHGGSPKARAMPRIVTKRTQDATPPIVAHYLTPHTPFAGDDFAITARNNYDDYPVDVGDIPHGTPVYAAARAGLISTEFVRLAYLSDLKRGWNDTRPLRTEYDNVIVTADHGELLGPDEWAHPSDRDENQLRVVPFWMSNSVEQQLRSPQQYGASKDYEWHTV